MELLKYVNNLNTLSNSSNRYRRIFENAIALGSAQNIPINQESTMLDNSLLPRSPAISDRSFEMAPAFDMRTMTARLAPSISEELRDYIANVARTTIREELDQFIGRINNDNTRNELANAMQSEPDEPPRNSGPQYLLENLYL